MDRIPILPDEEILRLAKNRKISKTLSGRKTRKGSERTKAEMAGVIKANETKKKRPKTKGELEAIELQKTRIGENRTTAQKAADQAHKELLLGTKRSKESIIKQKSTNKERLRTEAELNDYSKRLGRTIKQPSGHSENLSKARLAKNGGLSKDPRQTIRMLKLNEEAKKRDNYTCQKCGITEEQFKALQRK